MLSRLLDRRIALAGLLLVVIALPAPPALSQGNDRPRFAPDSEVREAFEPVIDGVRQSVVVLMVDGEPRALGTIIDTDGHVLTKASEIIDGGDLLALLHDDRRAEAAVVGVDRLNDLAMLKLDAERLRPAVLVDGEPGLGRWVACVSQEPSPSAVGIISAQPRAVEPPQLVLGVVLRSHPGGLRVVDLSRGFGADEAGVEPNDVITHIGEQKVIAVRQLVDRLQGQAVGDVIDVTLQRGEEELRLPIRLSELEPDPQSRGERMNRMGGAISERRRGFERVLQHDAELRPEHCGGPLVNLQGEVVGLNIARAGRIATYALPTSLIQSKLESLKSGDLAPNADAVPGEPIAQPAGGGQ